MHWLEARVATFHSRQCSCAFTNGLAGATNGDRSHTLSIRLRETNATPVGFLTTIEDSWHKTHRTEVMSYMLRGAQCSLFDSLITCRLTQSFPTFGSADVLVSESWTVDPVGWSKTVCMAIGQEAQLCSRALPLGAFIHPNIPCADATDIFPPSSTPHSSCLTTMTFPMTFLSFSSLLNEWFTVFLLLLCSRGQRLALQCLPFEAGIW